MSVLDKLFGKGNVTYHIAVAEALDSVAAAIFAEQIAFWQSRSEDGWAFRTAEQIREYTGLTRRVQDTARKHLKKAGVMEERHEGMPLRLYFRIDLEALAGLIEGGAEDAQNRQPDAPNAPTVRTETPAYIEGVESEKESSVETGEATTPSSPAPMEMGQFAVKELMDRVAEAKAAGKKIHSPTNSERKDFARQFKQAEKDGIEMVMLLLAFDYQVAKASGDIEGEPKAWPGYRTALDRVTIDGWRPRGLTHGDSSNTVLAKAQESRRQEGYEELFSAESSTPLSEEERRKLDEIMQKRQEEDDREDEE